MRTRQRGLSILGFLFVAAVVIVVVMVGFRVMPAYIEYYSVRKALEQSLEDAKDLNSAAEIRNAFQRRADAGYIESVDGKDVEVTKMKNEITASVSWTRKLPMVANASILLEFEATATK
jgi:sensor histidine kinase regulating citrate/malate metabolism